MLAACVSLPCDFRNRLKADFILTAFITSLLWALIVHQYLISLRNLHHPRGFTSSGCSSILFCLCSAPSPIHKLFAEHVNSPLTSSSSLISASRHQLASFHYIFCQKPSVSFSTSLCFVPVFLFQPTYPPARRHFSSSDSHLGI